MCPLVAPRLFEDHSSETPAGKERERDRSLTLRVFEGHLDPRWERLPRSSDAIIELLDPRRPSSISRIREREIASEWISLRLSWGSFNDLRSGSLSRGSRVPGPCWALQLCGVQAGPNLMVPKCPARSTRGT